MRRYLSWLAYWLARDPQQSRRERRHPEVRVGKAAPGVGSLAPGRSDWTWQRGAL